MSQTALEELKAHCKKEAAVSSAMGILRWDLETKMPSKGAAQRGLQLSTLSAMSHQLGTDPKIANWLTVLEPTLDHLNLTDQALVREVKRDYEYSLKLPESLVTRLSETSTRAHHAWTEARKNNHFQTFAPLLKELVALNQEEADCLGYEGSPYNALLDVYERDLTLDKVNTLFDHLRPTLVDLVKAIQHASNKPDETCLKQTFPLDRQEAFNEIVLKAMGFDLEAGRIDTAPHPFCSGSGPNDVRLTTRYDERDLTSSLFSIMHEGGHGLYEQGVNPELYGTPLCGGTSLGLHESQSRLWENMIGRSLPFWTGFYRELQATFPDQLGAVDLQDFYRAINASKPSLIRVEADEVTYNLHIMLRTEIEVGLIEGSLNVDELPEAWNAKMEDYLGIRPDSDSDGCLQDIHWSHGSFGYFPTYTLGNVYAAQFMAKAKQQLPTVEQDLANRQLQTLKQWLQTQIHWVGRCETAETICQRVCGEPLNPAPFLSYLTSKYQDVYSLEGSLSVH